MHALFSGLVAVCCVLLLATAGCGGDGTATAENAEPSSATDREPESPDPGPVLEPDDFCAGVSDVAGRFDLLEVSLGTDWAAQVTAMADGELELAAIEPPAELADDWASITDFFSLILDTFGDTDLHDDAAVQAVIEGGFGPETEAAAEAAQEAVARIDAYAESSCPGGGDSDQPLVGEDGCALLTAADLSQRVFVTSAPTAAPRSFGEGYVECIWSDGTSQVSLMVVPLAEFEREYIEPSTPISNVPIDDLDGGMAYAGTLGIGRFSTRGHSVSFTAGGRGGFVSVQIRDAGSRPVEIGEAARLARVLVAGL